MTRLTLLATSMAAVTGLALMAEAQIPAAPPQAPAAGIGAGSPVPAPATEAPVVAPSAPAAPQVQAAPEAPAAPPVAATPAPAAETPVAQTPTASAGEAPAAPAAVETAPAAAPETAPVATETPAAPGEVPATVPETAAPAPQAPADATVSATEPGAGPDTATADPALPQPEGADPLAAPTLTPILPSAHDLSPMGMYNQADAVVKSVMILLLFACFLTWTVWLFKSFETVFARARARRAARLLTGSASLESATRDLARRRDPAAFMAHAVYEEYRRSDAAIDPSGPDGVKERAASLVNRVEVQAASRMRRGMSVLATIGSVAPFVGLFGTVWGIMNAFIGIAETQTTNLAVVAPGIAEALFATALGLVAAIPAVVIYNIFTRAIAAYRQNLGDAGAAVLRLLSRDIDFRHVKGA